MDNLELQRLKAVADAARAVRKAANVTRYYGRGADRYTISIAMDARAWEALADALNVLDKERGIPEMGHSNGPQATRTSDSCSDVPRWSNDDPYSGTHISPRFYRSTNWHFPSPDVSDKDEMKQPVLIKMLDRGFEVTIDVWGFVRPHTLAFTDRVDAAEWLLSWLGFDKELTGKVCDMLASHDIETIMREARTTSAVWRYREEVAGNIKEDNTKAAEPMHRDAHSQYAHCMDWPTKWWERDRAWHSDEYKRALAVAETAQAYTNCGLEDDLRATYKKLVRAVKKWRGIEGGMTMIKTHDILAGFLIALIAGAGLFLVISVIITTAQLLTTSCP